MNTCPYCGTEYPDGVIDCPIDGTRMVEDPPSPAAEIISFRHRTALWAVAWGVAVMIMAIGAPSWAGFWAFPIFTPLAYVTGMILHSASLVSENSYFLSAAGWLYYASLTIWGLRSTRCRGFYCAFGVLCLSLLLNCIGWQAMRHTGWKLLEGGR